MASAEPLRDRLRSSSTGDFSLKLAWRELIRALRERKKATGEKSSLASRGAVEKALDSQLRVDRETGARIAELVRLLRSLVREPQRSDRGELAARAAILVQSLVLPVVTEPVRVSISGWPPGFGPALQERLVGASCAQPQLLEPEAAAAWVHLWDGFQIGGSQLVVDVQLPSSHALPAVPRGLRGRASLRGQKGPWLPHVDEPGRRSLTPRSVAERQAVRLSGDSVIDGMCGCGGNAIAFALAGRQVVAVELNAARLALAESNARALGVAGSIRFIHGDLAALLPGLLDECPQSALFLDPPWNEEDKAVPGAALFPSPRWPGILPGGAKLAALLPLNRPLMLKLPRSFDLGTLPDRPWTIHYEFGQGAALSALRMITAVSDCAL